MDVKIIPDTIIEVESGGWEIKGTVMLKGDTYEFTYEYLYDEYGGSNIDFFLDGVEQENDAAYITREDRDTFIADEVQGIMWDWLRNVREFQDALWARAYSNAPVVIDVE